MWQDCSSDFRIWMIKFQHLGSLPIMIILLVHVAFLYYTVYHLKPDQGRRTPPYQVPKEIQHFKYLQTITSVCVLIWKCKCNSGFARATVTTSSAVIPDGHACFGKTDKKYASLPCWHLIVTGASLMRGCGTMWILCQSQDQPLYASCLVFFFPSILQEGFCDYVGLFLVSGLVLFCLDLIFVLFCFVVFFSCCCSLARVSLWSHYRILGNSTVAWSHTL